MSVKPTKRRRSRSDRGIRFISAVLFLWLLGCGVAMMSDVYRERSDLNQFWLSYLLYATYLLIQAGLLIGLTGLLFRQHGLRQAQLSMASMLIIMTMLALPLGFAAALDRLAHMPVMGVEIRGNVGFLMPFLCFAFYFAILPLLMVCEAVMVWLNRIRLRKPR